MSRREQTALPWRRLASALIPLLVGLAALAVYLQTLLPGVGWGDIARFQYVARVWGIPHRFGYPLYIAVSRLFGALPLGNLAYRINLMSALFAALAAVTVYFLVKRLTHDRAAVATAVATATATAAATPSSPPRPPSPSPSRGRCGARPWWPRSIPSTPSSSAWCFSSCWPGTRPGAVDSCTWASASMPSALATT